MNTEVIIAVITVAGTMVSSFCGIMISNKLTNHRLEQLEKKVEKHNNLQERMAVNESSIKAMHERLDKIEPRVGR